MLISSVVFAQVLIFFTRSVFVALFARAGFSAGASAAIVTITGGGGFAAQGFELIPGLDVFTVEGFGETLFFGFDEDHDLVAHGQNVDYLAFAFGRDDALVAFRQCLARFDILFIFKDETTAQASAHAGDLVGGQRDALVFRHLDGDGREVGEKFGTAAGFYAAGAHAADDLRHIARTDLPHFDGRIGVGILHIPFERFEIDLIFAFGAEEERETRAIVVVFSGHDLDAWQVQFGRAGATVDHGFGLFGLPGLKQKQVTWSSPPLYGPPAAFGLRRRFFHNLHDLAEMLAAGCIHDDVLADSHVRDGGCVEMIDLAYFGETYTDNVCLHVINYTVLVKSRCYEKQPG